MSAASDRLHPNGAMPREPTTLERAITSGPTDRSRERGPSACRAHPLSVLLNATPEEVRSVGGDYTLYRNWLRLTTEDLHFRLVPPAWLRRHHLLARTVVEKLCYRWQPDALRRFLLIASRIISIPADAVGEADVILSHILFPWITRRPRPPVIWSTQGLSPAIYYERYSGRRWTVADVIALFRVLGREADALLISAETCARNLLAECPEFEEKVFCAPAPVFLDGKEPGDKPSRGDGVIRLLFVGVNARLKGLPEVIEAYRVIRRDYPRLQLDVVSRPPLELRKKIEALPGTRLWPPLAHADVMALMAQADIFVLPTYADTYALSAVEAMAHGCAIIISDLDPLPEICPPEEVGFTVRAGDITALAQTMKALVAHADRLRQFQSGARRRYERIHHPTVVAERLRAVVEKVSAGRKAGLHCWSNTL